MTGEHEAAADGTEASDLLNMEDEAGVIDTMFDALEMMAKGLQDRDSSDAFQRVVMITQDRFRLLQASIEQLHETKAQHVADADLSDTIAAMPNRTGQSG